MKCGGCNGHYLYILLFGVDVLVKSHLFICIHMHDTAIAPAALIVPIYHICETQKIYMNVSVTLTTYVNTNVTSPTVYITYVKPKKIYMNATQRVRATRHY